MNGELAQLVSLAAYGNEFLAGRCDQAPELFPGHSTFRFVGDLSFERWEMGPPPHSAEICVGGVRPWFKYLRSDGVRQLRLGLLSLAQQVPAHVAAGFSGGGAWALQAHCERAGVVVWRGLWALGNRGAADRRIWRVRYQGLSSSPIDTGAVTCAGARSDLDNALVNTWNFAQQPGLQDWASFFGRALERLRAACPDGDDNGDLLPAGFASWEARALLSAADASWAFGGMGSWNDVTLEDRMQQAEYDTVSDRLYQAVIAAIIAGANAGAPQIGRDQGSDNSGGSRT